MAGISRSAYYKYKDSVYPYQSKGASRLVTIHAVLEDRPGVLMALISSFYDAGANILTVNQNIPVMGAALVSISARVDTVKIPVDFLLDSLRKVDGVQISANDNRVCHVVELLENISDNQRQRKLQNDRKRTSLCHVFFHEKTSSK